jgi:acyl-[acyl-carrier-protein] desaturase
LTIVNAPEPRQVEVLEAMQEFVAENMLLSPIDTAWQPTDYLPDLRADDWAEQVNAFREPSGGLSDEILVVLVGDMVTEEALPSYAVALNFLARDTGGAGDAPWARWARGWTAEENRHGDLLNAYLRLTGRVDMRAVEVTIHNLISGGFEPRAHPDLYGGLVYTAFQERATKISHANVGKLAAAAGDAGLTRICQKIAADEARHEAFYTRAMGEVFRLDPEGALATCRSMLRRVIAMPGRRMYDGHDPDLFEHFAAVAQRTGVYTVHDYAMIVEHLVGTWGVAALSVGGKAARAQEYLCGLAEQCYKVAEEVGETLRAEAGARVAFSWVDGRRV